MRMRALPALLAGLLLAGSAGAASLGRWHLVAVDAAGAGAGCAETWMDRHLKLNDILAVGTHNSWARCWPA
jgi:hypothetical protein